MVRSVVKVRIVGTWLAVAIMALVLGAGLWRTFRIEPEPQAHFLEIGRNAYILPKPDQLAPFGLMSHDGKKFDNAALQGKWIFWFFGYTHCPDICPVTLAVFNQVHKILKEGPDGAGENVRFVFVSVDPERDTLELLGKYVPQFNPEFLGVTGNVQDLAKLTESVGVMFGKVEGTAPDRYFVDHSSAVLLTNPKGMLNGVFPAPQAAQDMVSGFLRIRERY